MQNRCETQFKIQKHTFSKINFFVGKKRNSTKGIEKNQVDISIRRVFGLKKLKNTKLEMKKETKKKKHVFEK